MILKLNIDLCIPPRFAWGVFTIVKEREFILDYYTIRGIDSTDLANRPQESM